MATLSQAYLEWEERTRAEGEQRGLERERALVIRQLTRQIGEISTSLRTRVEQLPLEQLENLGEALLGFKSVPDLENWLKTT
jgi:predicted transposase YdaD